MISAADSLLAQRPVPNARLRTIVLAIIVAVEVLALCLPAKWWGVAGLSLLVVGLLFGLLVAVLHGRGEPLVLSWILIFPLGYYFLSYPREHSLVTLDRALIAILLLTICFCDRSRVLTVPPAMRRAAAWWAVFSIFALLATLRTLRNITYLRLCLDAFLLPALLSWYVLRCFDVRKFLSLLHVLTCLMSLYVAAIGIGEIITQQDLLPMGEGGLYVAGDVSKPQDDGGLASLVIRPNGPFGTNNTFAVNGLVSLFFLFFLKSALRREIPLWQRVLHRMGVTAALAQAVMPLFRSVLISLVVVFLADAMYQHGRRRALRVATIVCLGSIFLALRIAIPAAFEERTNPVNLYDRIAQQGQTLAIFLDNPVMGVGIGQFDYAAQQSKYNATFNGLEAANSPHNNLGAILAETGLAGSLPFVVSQGLLIAAFWKLRRGISADSKLAWRTFLFIFLCYWINGMSLTIIYYGDLNIWFMVVLTMIYKFGITAPAAAATVEVSRA
jgi:hypothetical protein